MARLDGLEQLLVTYPDNVAGGYTVVPGDGTSHFGLVLNAADPPVCTQGYGGTDKRTAAATPSDVPANTDARCTLPRGSAPSVRGAQNAPHPRARSGAHASRAARTNQDDRTGRAAVSSSYLTGYDPTSGLALRRRATPRCVLGSAGGQARGIRRRTRGRWLLLGPLSR